MKKSYNFLVIEKKWQDYWAKKTSFLAKKNTHKKKFYVLDMFPYPSGSGLHVGHCLGYVATDIIARYYTSKGYNVLHPMGFDAFGLPAEQYAVETGQHPAVTTQNNIKQYKKQLKELGLAIDWSKEVTTTDPAYYQWTQWIFLQFFDSWYSQSSKRAEPIEKLKAIFSQKGNTEVGAAYDENTPIFTAQQWNAMPEAKQEKLLHHYRLAFLSETMVNWCPNLGTVLANSEVKQGFAERGGHPVIRKKMQQWSLRITAYADRLLKDLHQLDWPQAIKRTQTHWIGKSKGAHISFAIDSPKPKNIDIFTTRPDTIFGASYIALSPSHPLISELIKLQDEIIQRAESIFTEYNIYPYTRTVGKSPQPQITREHELTSLFVNLQKKLKAYITNTTHLSQHHEQNITGVFTGLHALHPFTQKKLPIWIADYVLEDYGSGAIMGVPAHDSRDYAFAKQFNLPIIQVITSPNHHDLKKEPYENQEGTLMNSDFLNGLSVPKAIETVIKKLTETCRGRAKIHYRLHDALFSRQRYWGEPLPIYYKKDTPYPLTIEDLPLRLPNIVNYKPTKEGKPPLAHATDWHTSAGHSIACQTMPSWAGSSWYFLRYMDPHNKETLVSSGSVDYWKAVDLYIGGSEHATGHLIYARFITKFLHDRGFINLQEPFTKLLNQGMIQGVSHFVYRIKGTNQFVSHGLKHQYNTTTLYVDINLVKKGILDIVLFKKWRKDFASATFILENGQYVCGQEIEKMSKSKHNTIQPNQIIDTYGADTLRLYLMFLGPITQSKPWNTQGIEGVFRFLQKVWKLFHTDQGNFFITDQKPNQKALKALHQAIKQVNESISRYAFNTAISSMMICVNTLTSLTCTKREVLQDLLRLLAPFAPHIAEELWTLMGNEKSILLAGYPTHNPEYLATSELTYPIAINGKVRAQLNLPSSATKQALEQAALQCNSIQKWLQGATPKKVIIVQNKMINIVL